MGKIEKMKARKAEEVTDEFREVSDNMFRHNSALRGIMDLVTSSTDLHLVRPDDLTSLLSIVNTPLNSLINRNHELFHELKQLTLDTREILKKAANQE